MEEGVLSQYSIAIVKHLSVKHRETLDSESALFNGFFRLEKLSIFETLGKKLTCLTLVTQIVENLTQMSQELSSL